MSKKNNSTKRAGKAAKTNPANPSSKPGLGLPQPVQINQKIDDQILTPKTSSEALANTADRSDVNQLGPLDHTLLSGTAFVAWKEDMLRRHESNNVEEMVKHFLEPVSATDPVPVRRLAQLLRVLTYGFDAPGYLNVTLQFGWHITDVNFSKIVASEVIKSILYGPLGPDPLVEVRTFSNGRAVILCPRFTVPESYGDIEHYQSITKPLPRVVYDSSSDTESSSRISSDSDGEESPPPPGFVRAKEQPVLKIGPPVETPPDGRSDALNERDPVSSPPEPTSDTVSEKDPAPDDPDDAVIPCPSSSSGGGATSDESKDGSPANETSRLDDFLEDDLLTADNSDVESFVTDEDDLSTSSQDTTSESSSVPTVRRPDTPRPPVDLGPGTPFAVYGEPQVCVTLHIHSVSAYGAWVPEVARLINREATLCGFSVSVVYHPLTLHSNVYTCHRSYDGSTDIDVLYLSRTCGRVYLYSHEDALYTSWLKAAWFARPNQPILWIGKVDDDERDALNQALSDDLAPLVTLKHGTNTVLTSVEPTSRDWANVFRAVLGTYRAGPAKPKPPPRPPIIERVRTQCANVLSRAYWTVDRVLQHGSGAALTAAALATQALCITGVPALTFVLSAGTWLSYAAFMACLYQDTLVGRWLLAGYEFTFLGIVFGFTMYLFPAWRWVRDKWVRQCHSMIERCCRKMDSVFNIGVFMSSYSTLTNWVGPTVAPVVVLAVFVVVPVCLIIPCIISVFRTKKDGETLEKHATKKTSTIYDWLFYVFVMLSATIGLTNPTQLPKTFKVITQLDSMHRIFTKLFGFWEGEIPDVDEALARQARSDLCSITFPKANTESDKCVYRLFKVLGKSVVQTTPWDKMKRVEVVHKEVNYAFSRAQCVATLKENGFDDADIKRIARSGWILLNFPPEMVPCPTEELWRTAVHSETYAEYAMLRRTGRPHPDFVIMRTPVSVVRDFVHAYGVHLAAFGIAVCVTSAVLYKHYDTWKLWLKPDLETQVQKAREKAYEAKSQQLALEQKLKDTRTSTTPTEKTGDVPVVTSVPNKTPGLLQVGLPVLPVVTELDKTGRKEWGRDDYRVEEYYEDRGDVMDYVHSEQYIADYEREDDLRRLRRGHIDYPDDAGGSKSMQQRPRARVGHFTKTGYRSIESRLPALKAGSQIVYMRGHRSSEDGPIPTYRNTKLAATVKEDLGRQVLVYNDDNRCFVLDKKNIIEHHPVVKTAILSASPVICDQSDRVHSIYKLTDGVKTKVGECFMSKGLVWTAGHVISVVKHGDLTEPVEIGDTVEFLTAPIATPEQKTPRRGKVLVFHNTADGVKDVCIMQFLHGAGAESTPFTGINILENFDPNATYSATMWWNEKGVKAQSTGIAHGNEHLCSGPPGSSGAPVINPVTQQVLGINVGGYDKFQVNIFNNCAQYLSEMHEAVASNTRQVKKCAHVQPHTLTKPYAWWEHLHDRPASVVPLIEDAKHITHVGFMPSQTEMSEEPFIEYPDRDFQAWNGLDNNVDAYRIINPNHDGVNKGVLKYDQIEINLADDPLLRVATRDLLDLFAPLHNKARVIPFREINQAEGAATGWVFKKVFRLAKKIDASEAVEYHDMFWDTAHTLDYPWLFHTVGKVENLPIEKVKQRAPRGFVIEPVEAFYYDARMNQHFNELMCDPTFCNDSIFKHGYTLQHGGFHKLIRDLTVPNGIWFSGDCKKWDSKFRKVLMTTSQIVRFVCWDKQGMPTSEWWERQNYIYEQSCHSFIVLPSGQVVQKHTGQGSGHARTTDDNCIGHGLVWCYLARKYLGCSLYDLLQAKKIRLALYADDHLVCVDQSLKIHLFDMRVQIYEHFGLELDRDKDLVTPSVVGQTFLGMTAVSSRGVVVPVFNTTKAINAVAKHKGKTMDPKVKMDRVVSYALLCAFDVRVATSLLEFHQYLRRKYLPSMSRTYTVRELQKQWLLS